VDLVFADPPFNIGYEYDIYNDSREKDDYLTWTYTWLLGCKHVLKSTGSIWVHIGHHLQAEVLLMMKELFYWRDTVISHYTFGPRQESKFTPSWVAMHYCTMDKKEWTWNADAIRVPSARQLKYNDKRAVREGKVPDNVWCLLPSENGDVYLPHHNAWMESRICGTFSERTGHPCQLNQRITDRIVRACTKPGDVVLDPFVGSGTTVASAISHGRVGWGIELSKDYLDKYAIPRLSSL
jgi:site-specific DNA-methyltransferase (adenine-specific)